MNYNYHIPLDMSLPLLPSDETMGLIQMAQNGCAYSKEHLVKSNMKLVINVVKRFKNKKELFEDLFQVGTIGLIKSIENFDVSRGLQFSTYAVPMVLGEIKRYLRDNHHVRVSRSIQDNGRNLLKFREAFIIKKQREPNVTEIAKSLSLSNEEVILALGCFEEATSLYVPASNASDNNVLSLEDKLSDQRDDFETFIRREVISYGLKCLSEKEKLIIELRYFLNKTQMEIARRLGMSQAHVSRMERAALSKMRKAI